MSLGAKEVVIKVAGEKDKYVISVDPETGEYHTNETTGKVFKAEEVTDILVALKKNTDEDFTVELV